jgi:hypothetical protein
MFLATRKGGFQLKGTTMTAAYQTRQILQGKRRTKAASFESIQGTILTIP